MIKDCIFCQIVHRQSHAYIIEETTHFVCFFPLEPNCYGHTLIVSRHHCSNMIDCDPELGADLFRAARSLFEIYRERLGATGFNLLNANGSSAGQSVDHLHFHFIPRFDEDGINAWPTFMPEKFDLDELFRCLKE